MMDLKTRRHKLVRLIEEYAPMIAPRLWPGADAVALLAATAEVESRFGEYAIPRYERAYDHGGRYCRQELWERWGAAAACSWGSFQLMYVCAYEIGYAADRPPWELSDDEIGMPWVIEFIKRRLLDKGVDSEVKWADTFNSGSWRDSLVPKNYIERFLTAVRTVKQLRMGGVP